MEAQGAARTNQLTYQRAPRAERLNSLISLGKASSCMLGGVRGSLAPSSPFCLYLYVSC